MTQEMISSPHPENQHSLSMQGKNELKDVGVQRAVHILFIISFIKKVNSLMFPFLKFQFILIALSRKTISS